MLKERKITQSSLAMVIILSVCRKGTPTSTPSCPRPRPPPRRPPHHRLRMSRR